MATRAEFRERLSRGPVLLDGGIGTELMKRGLAAGTIPETWLESEPEKVRDMHRCYAAAGAEALYTNSFGANAIKLSHPGLSAKASAFNRLAAALAREAKGTATWIVGSMGPTGGMLEPYGDLEEEPVKAAFTEQARALKEGGADLLVIETFTDLKEALLALAGALEAGDIPVMASMSFEGSAQGHRTMMGVTPEKAVEELSRAGADAVGTNCGKGVSDVIEVVKRMRKAAPSVVLAAKPNAGIPEIRAGKTVYPLDGPAFAAQAAPLLDLGVSLLGGCCGTGPDHIRALSALPAFTRKR
jgi:methionine synthase I (cobalamin-dependent)